MTTQTGRVLSFGVVAVAFITTALHAAKPFEVTPLPDKRNLHGSAVTGDYVHIFSGDEPQPKGFTPTVMSARVNDNLTLGEWLPNRPLPINLIYIGNNVLVIDNDVYIVGGQEVSDIPGAANPGSEYNQAPNNSAVYARVDADGRFGPWKRSSRYNGEGGQGTAAATDGRFLYVTGGLLPDDAAINEVHFAPILRDGSVGAWNATAPLPTPLHSHSAYFHNGTVYTFGGRMGNNQVTANVYQGSLNDDGTITQWTISPMKLAFPVELATACAADDFLFLFCGRNQEEAVVEQIQFSSLTPDGISPWGSIGTSMTARIYSSAALDRKRRVIYMTGGRFSSRYTDINDKSYGFPLRRPQTSPEIAAATKGSTFLPHDAAFERARTENKRMFLAVYSNAITYTRAEFERLASSSSFSGAANQLVLGRMDAAANPEAARNLGLIRVPSYLIISPTGEVVARTSGRKTEAELLAFATQ